MIFGATVRVCDVAWWRGEWRRESTFCDVSWTSYTAGGSSASRPMRTELTSYASARATTVAARSSVHTTALPHHPIPIPLPTQRVCVMRGRGCARNKTERGMR